MPEPTVVLAMIVKDEAHIIESCLRRVLPHIETWCIVDTGSSDDTRQIIERVMAGVPGELHRRPWVDFAHNRTECFELARDLGDYALVLDADDEWVAPDGFAWPDVDVDAFEMRICMEDVVWHRLQALATCRPWRWEDPVHASPVLDSAPRVHRLDVEIRAHATGHRHVVAPVEKYKRDAEIYERLLAGDPTNRRHAFYCAQSHRDAGQITDAMRWYSRRAQLGGWSEEVWYSHYQLGLLSEQIGADEQAVTYLLRAHDVDPERAEHLVALSRVARGAGRPALALLAAQVAAGLPEPSRTLFVEPSAYRWRAADELALASWGRGKAYPAGRPWFIQALRLNEKLVEIVPEAEKTRIATNIEASRAELGISTVPDDPLPRILVAGCGRSGTGFLAEVMRRAGVESGHERVFGPATATARWRHTRFEASWLCMPWIATLPDWVELVHLVRHPIHNAASWLGVGMFDDDPDPGHAPYRRALERFAPGVLERPTPLERWAAHWVVWTEHLLVHAEHRWRIEDLDASGGDQLAKLAESTGICAAADVRAAYALVPRDWNRRGRAAVTPAELQSLDGDLLARVHGLCDEFGYDLAQPPNAAAAAQ